MFKLFSIFIKNCFTQLTLKLFYKYSNIIHISQNRIKFIPFHDFITQQFETCSYSVVLIRGGRIIESFCDIDDVSYCTKERKRDNIENVLC